MENRNLELISTGPPTATDATLAPRTGDINTADHTPPTTRPAGSIDYARLVAFDER